MIIQNNYIHTIALLEVVVSVHLLLADASELCQTSPTERIRPIVRLNHVDGR